MKKQSLCIIALLSVVLTGLIYGPALLKSSPPDAIVVGDGGEQVNINFVLISKDKIDVGFAGNVSLWGKRVAVVDGSVNGKIPVSDARIYVVNGYIDSCDDKKFVSLTADKVELYRYQPLSTVLWERTKELASPFLFNTPHSTQR